MGGHAAPDQSSDAGPSGEESESESDDGTLEAVPQLTADEQQWNAQQAANGKRLPMLVSLAGLEVVLV